MLRLMQVLSTCVNFRASCFNPVVHGDLVLIAVFSLLISESIRVAKRLLIAKHNEGVVTLHAIGHGSHTTCSSLIPRLCGMGTRL